MKKWLILILFTGMIISCEKELESDTGIRQVSYGTSFGECIGYCKNEMFLSDGSVSYSRSGWTSAVEPVTCTGVLTSKDWNAFKNGIDPDKFFELPETFGCPDCADGGAEWIEMQLFSGKKHKVTFEYMNAPDELSGYVSALREEIAKSGECGQ